MPAIEGNGPCPARLRFALGHRRSRPTVRDRPTVSLSSVDVGPAEPAQFAAAHPAREREVPARPEAVVRLPTRGMSAPGQRSMLASPDVRAEGGSGVLGRVAPQLSPPNRVAERPVQHLVNVRDGPGRERLAFAVPGCRAVRRRACSAPGRRARGVRPRRYARNHKLADPPRRSRATSTRAQSAGLPRASHRGTSRPSLATAR